MSSVSTAFLCPAPLRVAKTHQSNTVCLHTPTRLSLSAPLPKAKAPPSQSHKGKRIPTYRKLQQRHHKGPGAFRKAAKDAGADKQNQAEPSPRSQPSPQKNSRPSPEPKTPRTRLRDLAIGQRLHGTVHNVVRHGAYVDIHASRDGLVHVRDMSVDFVHEVDDLLRPRDSVDVWVKYVDVENNVLGLTMIQPPLGFDNRVPVSHIEVEKRYRGVIQRVTNFGAYVDIGAERMAFLHVSALWGRRPRETLEFLRIGSKIWVAVKDVDEIRSHIRLSARAQRGVPLTDENDVVDDLEIPAVNYKNPVEGMEDEAEMAVISALAVQRPGDPLVIDGNADKNDLKRMVEADFVLSEDDAEDEDDDDELEDDAEDDEEEDEDGDDEVTDIVDEHEEDSEEEDMYEKDVHEEDDDDNKDEFSFVKDMDTDDEEESGVDKPGIEEIAHMLDETTEYVGLRASDVEKLQKLKASVETKSE